MRDWRRRILRAAATSAAAAALAGGCAFEPLHGGAQGAGAWRGSVLVEDIEGREGYAFRQALRRRIGDAGSETRYSLSVALAFEERGLAITQRNDVTRFDVVGRADFALKRRAEDGRTVRAGVARSASAYNTLATPYATRIAAQDARRRVAEDLAERVYAEISVALTDGGGAASGLSE